MSPTRRTRTIVALALALIVSIVGGWILSRSSDDVDATLTNPGEVQTPTIGTNADNTGKTFEFVRLRTVDGTEDVTLGGGDRPMVVNFWFATCEPCKREMPTLSQASATYEGRIDFVGINPNDSPESATAFLDKYSVNYPNYLDDGSQLAAAGVATMPATFFLAANGVILERHAGELTAGDLDEIISRLYGIDQ